MIIHQSMVGMQSSRSYAKVSIIREKGALVKKKLGKENTEEDDKLAELSASRRTREFNEKIRKLNQEKKEEWEKSFKADQARGFSFAGSKEEMKLETLRKILESLRVIRKGKMVKLPMEDIGRNDYNDEKSQISLTPIQGLQNAVQGGSVWVRQVERESFFAESETTAFSGMGMVKTADGREISFQVDLEMSRSFMEYNHMTYDEAVVMRDPLVINMDSNVAGVSDQKFLFDLDADGEPDEVSFLNKGSGFLALDKNEDGKINDGNELFGTKSGDGFQDLAAYDEDGNGWIDENDSIFHKLKIWTKNEDGEDRLIGLGKAGVGAIYLGNVSTDFSLNNAEDNHANAAVRKTGIFLKESGEAGTIQHVDFSI